MKKSKPKKRKDKSMSQLKREFDTVFSRWIRLKNSKDGMCQCVTCSVKKPIKEMQAGHYISRGYLSTRFDERNVHCQCVSCNLFKKGNIDEYTLWLIGEYGEGILEELNKKKWETKRYSRFEYESFIIVYKEKIKLLNDDGK